MERDNTANASPDRCVHVERACRLLWISMGLSTLGSLLTVLDSRHSHYLGSVFVRELLVLMIFLALVLWFTRMLETGRNWMRLLVSILFVSVCAAFAWSVTKDPTLFVVMREVQPIQAAILLVELALALVVVVLINTPVSRAWFAAHGRRR